MNEKNDSRLLEDSVKAIEEKIKSFEKIFEKMTNKLESLDSKLDSLEKRNANPKNKIVFDVGGTTFSTSRETLMKDSNSYFSALLHNEHWRPDPDGSYFIDRDPEKFRVILNYMRSGNLRWKHLGNEELLEIIEEFDYFQIEPPHELKKFMKTLLSPEHEKLITEWIGGNHVVGNRLWKASQDGFQASVFHSKCDNRGKTLVLVESFEGWIFGGYACKSWTTAYKASNSTSEMTNFLFTLTNPHDIPPTKYEVIKEKSSASQGGYDTMGPCFGNDLYIRDNSNLKYENATRFPDCYEDTTGRGCTTFTGSVTFRTKEIEVYQVVESIQ